MKEDRRRTIRIVIPDDQLLPCEGISRPLNGKVSVLGATGMYIRTATKYPAGTELELRLQGDGETLELSCTVRDVEPGGLGVEFTWLRGSKEEKLQSLMARLKD